MPQMDHTTMVLDWSTPFIRLSLHDVNHYSRRVGLLLMHLFYQGPIEVTNCCERMQLSPAGTSQMIECMLQQVVEGNRFYPGYSA